MNTPNLLTTQEFGAIFRVQPETVTRWIGRGLIPEKLIYRPGGAGKGRRILIDERAIQELMNSSTNNRSNVQHHYRHDDTDSVRARLMKFF